jgi:hypothetical protein
VPFVSTASAATAPSATPSRSVSPRWSTRAPNQNVSAKHAISDASGLTDADTKTAIGWNPTSAAPASCSGRRGPASSPISSQVAAVETSSSNTDHSRIA